MQGYVLVFRPGSSRGTILSDGGEAFAFCDPSTTARIEGGDVVAFTPEPGAVDRASHTRLAREVQVVRKWSGMTCPSDGPAGRLLFKHVQFEGRSN